MHILSASDDCTARIWNTATGECEAELKGHSSKVYSALFSSDGMHIVSASDDHTARIWNTATGECEAELKVYSSVLPSENMQLQVLPLLPGGFFAWGDSYGHVCLPSQPSFLAISENTKFHTKNFQKISIPPPFGQPRIISQHLSKICLGCTSGEVLVLEFLE
ncbi:WD40 repeat-like protein [Phlegmacium glaucopus]|nr:WD40 repeat-like protein [Phlegmacium glaucopus]